MKNIKIIKYLYENASSSIIALVSVGFLLSLIYNFSYFTKIGRIELLTLLGFSDYVESSIPFIILIIFGLFYAQITRLDINGILGRFKTAKNGAKSIKESSDKARKPFNYIIWFLSCLIFAIIITLQIIGVTLPYWVIYYFTFSAYYKALVSPHINENIFEAAIFFTLPVLIFFDFFIAMRLEKFKFRKMIFKILLITSFLSYSIGSYQASIDLTKDVPLKKSETIFLRAINKGIFSLRLSDRKIVFQPWEKINLIDN